MIDDIRERWGKATPQPDAIAHAPEDIARLLTEIENREALIEQCRALLDDFPGAIAPCNVPGGFVYFNEWENFADRTNDVLAALRNLNPELEGAAEESGEL